MIPRLLFRHSLTTPLTRSALSIPKPPLSLSRCNRFTTTPRYLERDRRGEPLGPDESTLYRQMAPKERAAAGSAEASEKLSFSRTSIPTPSRSPESADAPSKDSHRTYQNTPADGMQHGKLLSTPSRLLKLLVPLRPPSPQRGGDEPLSILVHPHQPLSYLERLLQAEIPPVEENGRARPADVTFHASHMPERYPDTVKEKIQAETEAQGKHAPRMVRWSAATEIGDFVRDAAKGGEFIVDIERGPDIAVSVPSFWDRSKYLRHRLKALSKELKTQAELKSECDNLAQKSAQKVATGGAVGLVSWWGAVWWLTFHTSLGWDVMEPVTYLVGLTTVISGYLWFLYHNREVSYRSVLHITVSRRQIKLYAQRGFDIDRWQELVDEGKMLRREIKTVAAEYDVDWDEKRDEGERVSKVLNGKDEEKRDREVRSEREEGREEEAREGKK